MDKDIRLLVSFKGHRKRKRLKMLLGEGYLDYLVDLWLTAAEDRPDGVLTGWDDIDIALAAGWEKPPKEIIDALIECKWLEQNDEGVYVLHNWHKRQGWVTGTEDRTNKGRIAALIKHHGHAKGLRIANDKYGIDPKEYGYDSAGSATGMPPASQRHADRMPARHAPSPSPSPSPLACNKLQAGQPAQSSKHYAKNTGMLAENITRACRALQILSKNNGKKFNVFAFVQQQINNRGHPAAVLESLDGLIKLWQAGHIRKTPWAIANGIFKTVNGNYNEAEAIREADKFKELLNVIAKDIAEAI